MGFLDGLMGNATEVDAGYIEEEYGQLLSEGEYIEKAYKLVRDLFIFTNKRIVLIDKHVVVEKKSDYHSVPYRSITHFTLESAGHFDLYAQLKIWISGATLPIEKQFKKDKNVYDIQRMLTTYVMKY